MIKNNNKNKFILILSFANFFDSGAILATGLALPVWTIVFGIDSFGIGILGALGGNCFGAAVGALIGGLLADKIGRNKTYKLGLVLTFIGFIVCIIAYSFIWLIIGFILLGISIGICAPVSWTYLSELSDKDDRSSNMGISHLARPLAIALMYVLFFIFSVVIPANDSLGNVFPCGTYWIFDGLLGSRLLFVVLAAFCIYTLIQNRKLSESYYWELSQKKEENTSFKKIIANKKSLLAIVFLVLVYAPWNIVAGAIGQYMPSIAKVAGVEGVQLALISITVCVVSTISVIVFSKLIKKYTYKVLFAYGAISGLISVLFMYFFIFQFQYWNSTFSWFIFVFAVLWGSQTGFSAQCFYSIWSSELFPTQARGTIQGIMFFLVRGISGLWSLFCFGVFDTQTCEGALSTIMFMAVLLVVTLIVGLIGCPKTQNKSLGEIEQERYQ